MEIDQTQILVILSIVFALFSELIGLNKKWESNSVIQIILSVGKKIFSKKEIK